MRPAGGPGASLLLAGACLCAAARALAQAPEAAAESAEAPPPAPLPTEAELERLLEAFDVPGAAVAGLTSCEVDERVVVAGSADLEAGAPVTPDTAFEAASLSKPVFAWLVMTLVEDGVVDLDRPIARDFDYARIVDRDAYARVTPRMILTHRTGMPNWVDEPVAFHERTAPIPFETPPDTAFGYSGEAFQLLQAFVEDRTGEPLQALFEARLGDVMPSSTFASPLPEGVEPSRGYASAADPSSGRDMDALGERAMAASSLVTTAGDYARFLARACTGEGLEAATREAMLRPQSPVPEDESLVPSSWALGWTVVELPGGPFAGHGGDNGEYRALAGFSPRDGHGVVVLTNGAEGQRLIDAMTAPSMER